MSMIFLYTRKTPANGLPYCAGNGADRGFAREWSIKFRNSGK